MRLRIYWPKNREWVIEHLTKAVFSQLCDEGFITQSKKVPNTENEGKYSKRSSDMISIIIQSFIFYSLLTDYLGLFSVPQLSVELETGEFENNLEQSDTEVTSTDERFKFSYIDPAKHSDKHVVHVAGESTPRLLHRKYFVSDNTVASRFNEMTSNKVYFYSAESEKHPHRKLFGYLIVQGYQQFRSGNSILFMLERCQLRRIKNISDEDDIYRYFLIRVLLTMCQSCETHYYVYDTNVGQFEIWTKVTMISQYVCDTSKPYDYDLEDKFHEHTVHTQMAYNQECGISRCSKAWARSRKQPAPDDDLIAKDVNGNYVDKESNVRIKMF